MKNKLYTLLYAITLVVVSGITNNSVVIAQTWTSVDGGGSKGINTSTATYSRIPSTAQFNGLLYSAWQEQNSSVDQVHIKSYNGTSWTAAGESSSSKLNSSSTNARNPKIAYFNGALYAAYEEYDASIYRIHVKKYNGSSWSLVENYSAGDGRTTINIGVTANATEVDLIVYNGYLYATWAEVPTAGVYNIRVSQFDGTFWTCVDGGGTYGLNYNTSKLAHTPRFAVYNNQLYLTWTEVGGASSVEQVRVRRYDGSSTWTFVDGNASAGLNYNSSKRALTPVMASYDNCLYLFWSEPYYETAHDYGDIDILRVRKYDGSSWSFVDGGGTSTCWNLNVLDPANNAECLVYNNLLYVTWNEADDVNFNEQVRCVQYNGSTKTFLDGGGVTSNINYNTSVNAKEPILTNYMGNLHVLWQEDNSGDQIRAKKTLLSPFVESVSVPADGTYIAGQPLNFTVNFSKNVVISSGSPYIPITLNTGGTVNAIYTSGSGTSTLTFRYSIVASNEDTDGISVGSAITLPGGCTLQSEDATPLTANLTLNSIGSTTAVLVDAVAPTITGGLLASSNSYIDVTFSEGVYGASDGVTALSVSKLSPNFLQNSGTATNVIISSVKKNDNTVEGSASALTGGETTVRVFLTVIGTPSGVETIEIKPASGTSVYDKAGNAVSSSQTIGVKNLYDKLAPTVSITTTASEPTTASPIPVTITFSETVSDFQESDIVVTNGSKSGFSGSGSSYTVNITPSNAGVVTVNVAAGVAADGAGNGNTVATQLSRTFNYVVPSVSFTVAAQSSVNESGTMTITAQLSATTGTTVTVPFTVNGTSTATSSTDYSISASPITIAAGNTTGTATITIATDALDEDNETIVVDMGTPTNATKGVTTTHTATITDDDDVPTVAFTAATQASTGETGIMTITAQLSAASGKVVTVPFTVNGTSTATSGTDYSISASPITIAAGSTTGTATITIVADALDEDNETVVIDLGTPTNATLGATTRHTATITDDDETPVVVALQNFSVNENSNIGAIVGTVAATDSDAGTTFSNWTITSNVNPNNNGTNAFAINSTTGQVTVLDAGDLDREANSSFTIKVIVSDGTNTSAEEDVVINLNDVNDINDIAPVVTAAQVFYVTEQAPNGTTVGTVLSTDGDVTTTTFQNWTITAGNSSGYFAINPSTGVITVVDNTGLNTSINPSFTLTLTVSDGTNTSSAQTVSIIVSAVNDDNPVITSSQSFAIDENAANSTTVGQVLATDPDYGTVFQGWTITAGNTGNAFAINSATGVITVNTSTALDYEAVHSFSLTIQVSDGLHTANGVVVVDLNNLNDNAPVVSGATFSINENSPEGTVVGTVVATDADGASPSLVYSISSGNTNNAFAINSSNGSITVNSSSAIDFESTPVFNLVISVSDGMHTSNADVKINLSDVVETGVEDVRSIGIAVYPNPAADKVQIKLNSQSSEIYSIELVRLDGVKVIQIKENLFDVKTIDLNGVVSGVYILRVFNQQHSFKELLVVDNK